MIKGYLASLLISFRNTQGLYEAIKPGIDWALKLLPISSFRRGYLWLECWGLGQKSPYLGRLYP